MLRGLIKKSLFIFIGAFLFTLIIQSHAYSFTNIKYDTNFYCADNAVAPLDSVMDIQTYLSCNGFSPGPIDGVAGGRTDAALSLIHI